jgi:chemotaxis protein methyltransferase CheR
MVGALDRYRQIAFTPGVRPIPRRRNPCGTGLRQAPSPSLFSHPRPARSPVISPADHLFLDELFRRAQLNIAAYRPSALSRRIPACLRTLKVRSPAEALRRLELDPPLLDQALSALLIGVTSFFRDPPVFAHLAQTAVPEILRRTSSPLILSAGCSDGAELYSLALCLLEGGAREMTLSGLDCRRRAIDRARAGQYAPALLSNVPPALREKYLYPAAGGFQIRDSLAQYAHWRLADALAGFSGAHYDLVACRNLAIYLEHAAVATLWRRLHAALRPGGFLLAGRAERPTSGFVRAGPCLFRKVLP